jgi:hypothetical protein
MPESAFCVMKELFSPSYQQEMLGTFPLIGLDQLSAKKGPDNAHILLYKNQ